MEGLFDLNIEQVLENWSIADALREIVIQQLLKSQNKVTYGILEIMAEVFSIFILLKTKTKKRMRLIN